MAMRELFPGNGNGFYVEYDKREDHFIVCYKDSARFVKDPVEVRRSLGYAKFTATGDAVKSWAVDVCTPVREKRAAKAAADEKGRADTSFASEAMSEEQQEDPTHNTRMVI